MLSFYRKSKSSRSLPCSMNILVFMLIVGLLMTGCSSGEPFWLTAQAEQVKSEEASPQQEDFNAQEPAAEVKKASERAAEDLLEKQREAEEAAQKEAEEAAQKEKERAAAAAKKQKDTVAESKAKGAVGRWKIPDVGVNVAVYQVFANSQHELGDDCQKIVNAKDSAALYYTYSSGHNGLRTIADHNYQGFEALKRCTPGMTAYLDYGDTCEAYTCVSVLQGINDSTISDINGRRSYEFMPYNGIMCYTCNDSTGYSITIVVFAPA